MKKLGWKEVWGELRFFSKYCLFVIAIIWAFVLVGPLSLMGGLVWSGVVTCFYVAILFDSESKVLCTCGRVLNIRERSCKSCGEKNDYAVKK